MHSRREEKSQHQEQEDQTSTRNGRQDILRTGAEKRKQADSCQERNGKEIEGQQEARKTHTRRKQEPA